MSRELRVGDRVRRRSDGAIGHIVTAHPEWRGENGLVVKWHWPIAITTSTSRNVIDHG